MSSVVKVVQFHVEVTVSVPKLIKVERGIKLIMKAVLTAVFVW